MTMCYVLFAIICVDTYMINSEATDINNNTAITPLFNFFFLEC